MTPAHDPARVFAFSLGFFTDRHLRRALGAIGIRPRFGWPGRGDRVLVWGRRPVSWRGRAMARLTGASVLTVEDGFLRSVATGREGEPGFSLILDDLGIYFETDRPSRFAALLDEVARTGPAPGATAALERWRKSGLSKYNPVPAPTPGPAPTPDPGATPGPGATPVPDLTPGPGAASQPGAQALPPAFVLVVDQTRGDASIRGAGADAGSFARMLAAARADHPALPLVIKTHPEVAAGRRAGHFGPGDLHPGDLLLDRAMRPVDLLARAAAVYCVSSLLGMEAMLHGHRPVVFGDAAYAGRGLSDDRHPRTRPRAALTRAGLFDAAYLRYARYLDRALGRETGIDAVMQALSDTRRAAAQTAPPVVLSGMRLWKRGFLRRMFPALLGFEDDPRIAAEKAARAGGRVIVWSGRETPALQQACALHQVPLLRMEDGFLRSAGLGADLVAPASLALDDLGIYYDPTRESRMERLIARAGRLAPGDLSRAAALRAGIVAAGVSKYNMPGALPGIGAAPGQEVVLVPGQVEDDQSILRGAQAVRGNADLLRATRDAFPRAWILYKPHPDVLAGLRDGGTVAAGLADQRLDRVDITRLLDRVDRVSTITSLTGFEALLRGRRVTCFGVPFYAGWGLTDDRAETPGRRGGRIALDALVQAALIDYPLYWDPLTGLPAAPETVVERLARGTVARRGRGLRLLAKAQGLAAGHARLWR